jgi:hypothetical protein
MLKDFTACFKKSLASINEMLARKNSHFLRPFLLLSPR